MKLKLLSFTFTLLIALSVSQNFECSFKDFNQWGYPQILYICNVTKYPELNNSKLKSPTGEHQDGKNNSNVEGFNFENLKHKIDFFPLGLDDFFPNLKAIKIKSMGLKEIHQKDLKPFTELIVLNLYGNEIKNIEKDLFKFNPKLTAISFQNNQISYIEMHVFDHLKSLSNLFLGNVCITDSATTHAKVAILILAIEKKCSNVTQETMLEEIGKDLRHTKIEVEKSLIEIRSELKSQDEKLNETKIEIEKIDGKLIENFQELKSEKIQNFQQEFLNLKQNLTTQENYLNSLKENFQTELQREIKKLQNNSEIHVKNFSHEISKLKEKFEILKLSQLLDDINTVNQTLANLKLELLNVATKPQSEHIASDDLIPNKSFITFIIIAFICLVTIFNVLLSIVCFRRKNVVVEDKKEKIHLKCFNEVTTFEEIDLSTN